MTKKSASPHFQRAGSNSPRIKWKSCPESLSGEFQATSLAMEQAIVDALKPGNQYRVGYLEIITDEDRLEHYKLMAIRCEVEG